MKKSILAVSMAIMLAMSGCSKIEDEEVRQHLPYNSEEYKVLADKLEGEDKELFARFVQEKEGADNPSATTTVGEAIKQQRAKEQKEKQEQENKKIQLEKERQARAKLDDLKERWEANSMVASRTSRIALAPIVKDMQAFEREVKAIEVTPCLEDAKASLLKAIQVEFLAYLSFMEDSDATLEAEMTLKYEALSKYSKKVMECAPNK